MSDFSDWKKANPKGFKKLCIIVAVAAVAMFASGVFWGNKAAKAAAFTVDCGAGNTGVWTAPNNTVTCVKDGTTPPPVVTPPTPPTGDRFAGCPAGALKIDRQWGNSAIHSRDFGAFAGNIMSVRIDVPINWQKPTGSSSSSNWAQYASAPTIREGVMSHKACSFERADALKVSNGQPMWNLGANAQGFVARYGTGPATQRQVQVVPGGVYFINIRNQDSWGGPTCFSGNCDMIGGLPQ